MILEPKTNKERRYSQRWPCCKPICYRVRGEEHIYEASLRERSLNGMVIVSSRESCPSAGTYLVPADAANAERHGFRLAYVCRTGQTEDTERPMYVEILA
jgi:hypothetical protein